MNKITRPEMIMFDFGNTLADGNFDGVAGCRAVLEHAHNPDNVTAEQVQAFAEEMNVEAGIRYDYQKKNHVTEIYQYSFQNFLYEYLGISFDIDNKQIERIFWDNANPIKNSDGIEDFLSFLKSENIRTGVISNLTFTSEALAERLNQSLPDNDFEFIIGSSDYVFRKPHRFIFELALKKAGLTPDKVWYCGDNPYCDVEGAYNAGIVPVWYIGCSYHEQHKPEVPCVKVSHWRELEDLIKHI